jgi:hypothetical protein
MSIPTEFQIVNLGSLGLNFLLTKNFGDGSFQFYFADANSNPFSLIVTATNVTFQNANTLEVIAQTSFGAIALANMQNALVAQTCFIQIANDQLTFGFTNLVPEFASLSSPIFGGIDRVNIDVIPTVSMTVSAVTIQSSSNTAVVGIVLGVIGGLFIIAIIIVVIWVAASGGGKNLGEKITTY